MLALDVGKSVADLEIAVIDRLETPRLPNSQRDALTALRGKLREWRQAGVRFESRSIIVAHRGPEAAYRAKARPTARSEAHRTQ